MRCSDLVALARKLSDALVERDVSLFDHGLPFFRLGREQGGQLFRRRAEAGACEKCWECWARRPSAARERVCFAQKPIAATKKWPCGQPNNHSAAALRPRDPRVRQQRLKDGRGADLENAVSEYCRQFCSG